ncbi:hypothetical protein Tco_1523316 [Tanacetum coccineum]
MNRRKQWFMSRSSARQHVEAVEQRGALSLPRRYGRELRLPEVDGGLLVSKKVPLGPMSPRSVPVPEVEAEQEPGAEAKLGFFCPNSNARQIS